MNQKLLSTYSDLSEVYGTAPTFTIKYNAGTLSQAADRASRYRPTTHTPTTQKNHRCSSPRPTAKPASRVNTPSFPAAHLYWSASSARGITYMLTWRWRSCTSLMAGEVDRDGLNSSSKPRRSSNDRGQRNPSSSFSKSHSIHLSVWYWVLRWVLRATRCLGRVVQDLMMRRRSAVMQVPTPQ